MAKSGSTSSLAQYPVFASLNPGYEQRVIAALRPGLIHRHRAAVDEQVLADHER
jgi:hypothetical protein